MKSLFWNKIIKMKIEMTRIVLFFSLCALIGMSSCETPYINNNENLQYFIHVAHTRQTDTIIQKVDPRIEKINYDFYDMTLLGGDLTEETSKSYETLEYLEGVFDLDHPNTLWALGNHDNANIEDVKKATQRPITYTYHKEGITFVVLDTQEKNDWKCTITGDQLTMLQQVMDTISTSSHLVVMTHKLVWLMHNPEFTEHQGTGRYDWSCNYTILMNNWNKDILPRLKEVQRRGVQVLCLAGDIGNNVRTFHEKTADNIHYLASGICIVKDREHESNILLFKHDLLTKELFWRFAHLDTFLEQRQYVEAESWHILN